MTMHLRTILSVVVILNLLAITGCTTDFADEEVEIKAADLNYCKINPELLITSEPEALRTNLKVQYCNHIPSNGDLQIIIVEVHGSKYIYSRSTPIGVKVYSEYRFRKNNGDLLLMSYGGDSPDDEGNLFDYDLYEIGTSYVLRSGRSKRRPRLLDIL